MKKLFIINSLVLLLVNVNAQDNTTDSLKQLLSVAIEDTNKVQILINLGWVYQWSKPDTAIQYGLQALQLSQQLNFTRGEIEVAQVLTEAFCTKGNFSKALEIDLNAMQAAEQSGNQKFIDSCLRTIALVYFYSGDYKKALNNFIKFKENESDSGELILGFIGEAYFHLNQLDSASFYIKKAYEIDKNSNKFHWTIPYYYTAAIEAKKGMHKEALDNYKKGILFSNDVGLDLTLGYNGMATLFKQIGEIDSSIYYAKKTITIAQQESLIPQVIDAAAILTEAYSKKNTDSAFKYQRVMLAVKDSLFSEEKIKQLQNLSFNEQMRQQELQQTIQQTQLKYRTRLNIYILLAGLLILLIVALGLWRRNIFKQKSFALLQKQKEQIQSTLTQLKSTQAQLIQSEKMASLGELTAGIAHEIQNPLNFVNNFSEVNKEMLEELKAERLKPKPERDEQTEAEIIEDVIANSEKINHHGKRADAIVKGMLQHSQTSKGQKEPTDINALCDEYLRLSYHGLRAKDKSFNATLITDFDGTIGTINIIPQDIGRVLLNLYNNAFYAVTEKKKQSGNEYEPTVTVSTSCSHLLRRGVGGEVSINVKDNGKGIPQKIIDKIFQPFFTTKPTGQGTGLGLSLSYDIIKAHGGEIKVKSKEGEGSEFIIQLPIV